MSPTELNRKTFWDILYLWWVIQFTCIKSSTVSGTRMNPFILNCYFFICIDFARFGFTFGWLQLLLEYGLWKLLSWWHGIWKVFFLLRLSSTGWHLVICKKTVWHCRRGKTTRKKKQCGEDGDHSRFTTHKICHQAWSGTNPFSLPERNNNLQVRLVTFMLFIIMTIKFFITVAKLYYWEINLAESDWISSG